MLLTQIPVLTPPQLSQLGELWRDPYPSVEQHNHYMTPTSVRIAFEREYLNDSEDPFLKFLEPINTVYNPNLLFPQLSIARPASTPKQRLALQTTYKQQSWWLWSLSKVLLLFSWSNAINCWISFSKHWKQMTGVYGALSNVKGNNS